MRIACRAITPTVFLAALAFHPATAQVLEERVDLTAIERIRDEGLNRSQVQALAVHLTDVIGPRLTGSPAMRQANDWTAEKFREWGLANVTVAPWGEFGRGWERVHYAGRVVAPFVQPLYAQPVAWTGSTRGTVTGPAVIVDAASPEEVRALAGRIGGAFLLLQPPAELAPEFERGPLRRSLDDLLAPATPDQADMPQRYRERMAEFARLRDERIAVRRALDELMAAEPAAALLQPSPWTYGILRVGGNAAGREPRGPIPPPELVVSHEQYGQIYRNVKRGVPVSLEVRIENRFHEADTRGYNTLADLPGSDLAHEYVMIGAHLDSWHAGTGATDNAAGSVVMMEAMRILRTLGLQPRRTIRIALWSGEEQGLLGSRNWVDDHRELWPRISAYLNVDNGTGRVRGIWAQGNERAIPVFEQILWPFKDLGVVAVHPGSTGGTDHLAFDRVGIPGFNFMQDPIEYGTRSHHSHADTFERLVLEDLKQAAVVVAATAFHQAMRDELMPRKPAATAD